MGFTTVYIPFTRHVTNLWEYFASERDSFIDILHLEEVVDKPLMIKINALIAALTLETISDMTVLGIKTEKIRLLQGLRC